MRLSQCSCAGSLALTLACSSPTPMAASVGSESGSTNSETRGSTTEPIGESETETDTGETSQTCSTEWDCEVGERCLEGDCTCVGCGCEAPNIVPGTIDAPEPGDDEVPVFLDVGFMPECLENSECDPLEYCDEYNGLCTETTACVQDLDCLADWPDEDRFCVDDLCQRIHCYDEGDTVCPAGSLCSSIHCRWLDVAPDCVAAPSFDETIADTLLEPDTADVVVLDVDLDGRDDIVVLEDGLVHWVQSIGVGFGPAMPWAVEPGTQFVGIAGADVHGDGVDELLVLQADPVGVEILAAGPSWPQWIGFADTMAVPETAAALDIDYDGLPELVTGTSIAGPMTLVEAQLGDGLGTFEPLWNEAIDPIEFSQPAPDWDNRTMCTRALGGTEVDGLRGQRLAYDGVDNPFTAVDRTVAGHMFFPETPQHPEAFVATAPLTDRGVLFFRGPGILELAPAPGPVVLLVREADILHVIVDHGAEPAEFVEFSGNLIDPLCRGNLEFSLDAVSLDVGDFDGDGREDLLSRGKDGTLHVWYSRD